MFSQASVILFTKGMSARHPPGRHLTPPTPSRQLLQQTGRYASYWNAFLLQLPSLSALSTSLYLNVPSCSSGWTIWLTTHIHTSLNWVDVCWCRSRVVEMKRTSTTVRTKRENANKRSTCPSSALQTHWTNRLVRKGLRIFCGAMMFFLNGELSLNSANLGNLTNHWSMNWVGSFLKVLSVTPVLVTLW